MPERLQQRSALQADYVSSRSGGRAGRPAGVQLSERRSLAVYQLIGARDVDRLAAILSMLGLAALPKSGQSGGRAGCRLVGLGPDAWMVVAAGPSGLSGALDAATGLAPAFAAAVDLSDSWTVIEVAGADAEDLLGKGCALDLDPAHFAAGSAAQLRFAQSPAVLLRPDPGQRFELFVGRSHARHVWRWLIEAAAEFGCDVAPEGRRP